MSDQRGIPFGDPRHPWKANSEHARKAGKVGLSKSPWRKRNWVINPRKKQAPRP